MQKISITRIATAICLLPVGCFLGYQLMSKMYDGVVLESNLVGAQTQSSTYLRPEWWAKGKQGSLEFYGDWPKGLDVPRARMLIVDSTDPLIRVPNASVSLDALRDDAVRDISKDIASYQSPEDKICHEFSNNQIKRGTATRGEISDLLTLTAECKNKDKKYTYYLRWTIDDSRQLRLIAFISERWIWDKNEKIFLKMIDSVAPLTSTNKV